MLGTVFYFILNMSIASCFVITALLLIRQIRPLPKRVVYPLWALAFFRLVTPFSLPARWSLFNFTGGLVKRLVTINTVTEGMVSIPGAESLWAMNMIGAAEQYAPVVYKTESFRQVFTAASVIWIIAAVVLLLTAAALYLLAWQELKKAIRIKDNIYRSDMLLSPALTGIFYPKIILPASFDPDGAEAAMVLAHENVHRRRLDNLWRLMGFCITCLHWFNPLAWIMLKAFFTDMELSCDERVIRKFSLVERRAYAGALLRFAEDKRLLVSASFGHTGVKTRIVNVLNYKQLTTIGILASSLFLLTVVVALITNPQLRG